MTEPNDPDRSNRDNPNRREDPSQGDQGRRPSHPPGGQDPRQGPGRGPGNQGNQDRDRDRDKDRRS